MGWVKESRFVLITLWKETVNTDKIGLAMTCKQRKGPSFISLACPDFLYFLAQWFSACRSLQQ